ncbi:dihydroorotate dehydrogenase [bacterium]|nr:dihydroorotate dehydrogenase [bacterium]
MSNMDLSVRIGKLTLKNPVITASGTFGYGLEYPDLFDPSILGAFTTKAIKKDPTHGHPPMRIVETTGGMINAIGLQNVGVEKFINEKLPLIEKLYTHCIVNLAGTTIEEFLYLTEKLANQKAVSAFELNISCPNVKRGGMLFGQDSNAAYQITKAVKEVAEGKTLIPKLTPNVTDITEIASACIEGGADALSMINTLSAMAVDIKTRKPILSNVFGGLSGPAIKPVALAKVYQCYTKVCKEKNIPIIGMGGIVDTRDALEFILCGATAIAIGTGNFINPLAPKEIIDGLARYLKNSNINSIKELIGTLEV